MTALNSGTIRVFESQEDSNSIPIAANTVVYQGSLVGKTSDGYGCPLQAGDTVMGFAKDSVDNTDGEAGAKAIDLKARGKVVLKIPDISQANLGHSVYASDDNTFTLTDSNVQETENPYIGKIVRIEKQDQAVVFFDFMQSLDITQTVEASHNTNGTGN